MTKALSGFGCIYGIHDGLDPGVFTDTAELVNIDDAPNDTADDIEATHHQSPGRRKEYIAGLLDGGEASFTINWVPGDTEDDMLQALKASGQVRRHRITWPNGVIWTFEGYIKGLAPAAPVNDRMTLQITVKVSGATTITKP